MCYNLPGQKHAIRTHVNVCACVQWHGVVRLHVNVCACVQWHGVVRLPSPRHFSLGSPPGSGSTYVENFAQKEVNPHQTTLEVHIAVQNSYCLVWMVWYMVWNGMVWNGMV